MNSLVIGRDNNGSVDASSIQLCDYINVYILSPGVSVDITIPAGARHMLFSSCAQVWLSVGAGSAEIPTTDITDGSGPFLNPYMVTVSHGEVYSIVSGTGGELMVAFYG